MGCICEQLPLCWIACIIGGILLLKYYMQGGKYRKSTSAGGKVVIVTGANTGIGKETVRELAKRGATIYMACRDVQKCEKVRREIIKETSNKYIYTEKLDLASLKSIKDFVNRFTKTQARLDILINNAGVMNCPYSQTEDGFEMQLGVNHIGHFLLTTLLLDLLKKSAPSRIVVVSSKAHTRGKINKEDLMSENSYGALSAYCQSKLANVLFTRELANRLKGTGVTVNALHPGVVSTELGRHTLLLSSFLGKILSWPLFKTAANGAQTTIYAALDPDLDNVSGKYFSDCKPKAVSKAAEDDETAKWLWDETERLIKLKFVQQELEKEEKAAKATESTDL